MKKSVIVLFLYAIAHSHSLYGQWTGGGNSLIQAGWGETVEPLPSKPTD